MIWWRWCLIVVIVTFLGGAHAFAEVKATGLIGIEGRLFPESPLFPQQSHAQVNSLLYGDTRVSMEGPEAKCVINLYGRYNFVDNGSNIFDIHGLKCETGRDGWHLKVGYDVEFWGVLEFVNPTNIINQRDINEDLTGKRRLGQPMVNLTLPTSMGTIDLYALEFFKPLKFPGPGGRLRPFLPIHDSQNQYESESGRLYPEFALRYTKQIDKLSAAISYFHGYSREPEMEFVLNHNGDFFLIPHYSLEHQGGMELQLTTGNLILKTEDVVRFDSKGDYRSHAIGFGTEYDLAPLIQTESSVTLYGEYIFDRRGKSLINPFGNDLLAGLRIGFNDKRSTELTIWSNLSLSSSNFEFLVLDGSTRITDNVRVIAGLRKVLTDKQPFEDIRKDSYFLLKIQVYF